MGALDCGAGFFGGCGARVGVVVIDKDAAVRQSLGARRIEPGNEVEMKDVRRIRGQGDDQLELR